MTNKRKGNKNIVAHVMEVRAGAYQTCLHSWTGLQ
jgi:hypothetical protein